MGLPGWDDIPAGYGAQFDLGGAPWWLKLWFSTPFVDRYAYPQVVRRGYGYLAPMPDWPDAARGPITAGWRLRDPGYVTRGSVAELKSPLRSSVDDEI